MSAIVAAVSFVGVMMYQQNEMQKKAQEQQERAMQQAADNARKQEALADQAMNKANQKKPDVASMLAANANNGRQGASGTMLTGPQGLDSNGLLLGKNTLLGS